MRRFIAFIIMALSLVLVVGFNLQFHLEKMNYGLEFAGGYEVVYHVEFDEGTENQNLAEVSDLVTDRLEVAGVKNSRVDTEFDEDENYYQLRVVLTPNSSANLENILRSVEATKPLSVCTYGDRCAEEEVIDRNNVSVKYDSGTPSLIIGLKNINEFKGLLEHSEENTDVENAKNTVVIWMNKTEADTYEEAKSDSFEGKKMQEKIIAIVTAESGTNFDEEAQTLTITNCGYDKTDFASAEQAHSYQRILTSSEHDFVLTKLYQHYVDPSYGNGASSKIVLAIGIALLVLAIYFVYSYGWAGVVGVVSILASLFVDIVLFNGLGFQMSPAIVIGIVAVIGCSIIFLISYFEKFKDELKKGRNPLKASNEAFKRSKYVALDASILLFAVGLVAYFVARQQLKYFSLFLIVGSLSNLIFTTLLGKWMMYWLCGSSYANNHLNQFGVKFKNDEETTSEVSKTEEDKKDEVKNPYPFMAKKGRNAIIAGGLTLVSVAAILVLGLFTTHFNYTDDFSVSGRVDIVTNKTDMFVYNSDVEDFFKADDIKLDTSLVNIVVQNDPNQEDEDAEIAYITAQFDFAITDQAKIETIKNKILDEDGNAKVYVSSTTPVVPQNTFNSSLILLGVTAAMATAYILVRFGLRFGLATAGILLSEGTVALGLLSVTRVAVNSYAGIGILGGVALTALLVIPFIEKVKQLTREYKVKVTVYEQREEIALKAYDSYMPTLYTFEISLLFLIVILLALCPSSMSSLYIGLTITLLLGIVVVLYLLVPFYLFMCKHLRYHRLKKLSMRAEKKRRAREEKARRNPGSEPQEAIIPGIND